MLARTVTHALVGIDPHRVEVEAHIQFMRDFATRLEGTGEYVGEQALSPEGVWARYDGEGRPPVTDGPFAETKDLIAGWMVIYVDSQERALELAGELSSAPVAGGERKLVGCCKSGASMLIWKFPGVRPKPAVVCGRSIPPRSCT